MFKTQSCRFSKNCSSCHLLAQGKDNSRGLSQNPQLHLLTPYIQSVCKSCCMCFNTQNSTSSLNLHCHQADMTFVWIVAKFLKSTSTILLPSSLSQTCLYILDTVPRMIFSKITQAIYSSAKDPISLPHIIQSTKVDRVLHKQTVSYFGLIHFDPPGSLCFSPHV